MAGSSPTLALSKKQNVSSPLAREYSILRGASVTESSRAWTQTARARLESCVWRAVSFHSSDHPREVLLAQFSLCVHKSGKPKSFHFISRITKWQITFYIHYIKYSPNVVSCSASYRRYSPGNLGCAKITYS